MRTAFVAGAIAALAVLAKSVVVAFGLEALSTGEGSRVIAIVLGCGALLAAVAHLRRRSWLAAAALIVAALPLVVRHGG